VTDYRRAIGRGCLVAIFLLSLIRAQAQDYRNIVNLPFNTVTNGPQSALVVDVDDPNNQSAVLQAIQNRLRATRGTTRLMEKQLEYLSRFGLVKPGHRVQVYHTVVLRSGGRLLLNPPPRTRQETPKVQFVITTQEGWSLQQAQFLKQFADQAYNTIEQIYGPPANDITVRVIRATTLTQPEVRAGGVYVASTTPRQILLPPTQGFDDFVPGDTYDQVRVNLLHLMIRAFHDTYFLRYHAWEEGISRAATTVAMTLVDRNVDLTTAFEPYFLMQVYDLVNQPSLGNSTFFPASGFDGMLIFRLGMSASAWLKVYIENPNFFREFNNAYYAQAQANPDLAGNIPRLRAIVKGIVPQVEGLDFDRWYERQYVLDTGISPGNKLYAFNAPLLNTKADDKDYSVVVLLGYYNTDAFGNETPLSGTTYPIYRDSEYVTINPGAQYERVDIADGMGAVNPNFVISDPPDTQRIIADFTVNNESARIYFPFAAQPSVAGDKDFFIVGCIIGADSGEMVIQLRDQGNTTLNASVKKGAFGAGQNTLDVLYSKALFTYGGQITRQINFLRRAPADNFDYLAVLFFVKENVATKTFNFQKGLSMISMSIRPFETDISKVFNLSYDRFIIAHWDQKLPGDYKYRLNQASPPIRPDYGYWLKLDQDLQVSVTGIVSNPDAPYPIGLVEGWNLIGFPFDSPVDKIALQVQYLVRSGDSVFPEIMSFNDAVSSGWIGGSVWEYNPVTGSPQDVAQLKPGKAYWIKAKRTFADNPFGMTLLVPPPAAAPSLARSLQARAPVSQAALTADAWHLTLVARTGDREGQATLGVSRTARDGAGPEDSEAPPVFQDYVAIRFPHPDWRPDAGDYVADVRSAALTRRVWEFEVQTDRIGAPVTLTWPQAARLPRNIRLTLTDLSTGDRRFLRTTSAYTYKANSSGARQFRIEADASGAAGLMITGLTAVPNRGSTVTIAYTLSAPAQVTAQILTLTGKPVRTITSGRAAPAGVDQMVWDGRSQRGAIVPGGAYLVQITARSAEGEVARAVVPVTVGR